MTAYLKNTIRSMRALHPPTKAGVVRGLIPEIEDARMAGYPLKTIWTWLRDDGLDVSYALLCTYLNKARKQRPSTQPVRREPNAQQPEGKTAPDSNGLLNLMRQREVGRARFNYRGTQDLELLIAGPTKKGLDEDPKGGTDL